MYFQYLCSIHRFLDEFVPSKYILKMRNRKILHEPAKMCVDDPFLSLSCYLDLNVLIWALKGNGNLEFLKGPSGCSWRTTSAWIDVHQWVGLTKTNMNYQFQDFLINFHRWNFLFLWEIDISFMNLQEAVDEPFQLNGKSFCIDFFTNHHPKPFLRHGKSISA